MRILLTNDDGISAPGIVAMFDALSSPPIRSGEPSLVFPIAPHSVQSATSHGVTFHAPLMVRRERMNDRMSGLSVDGRPADCVKLAIANLWPEQFGEGARPDLLISGMNAGANCGINTIYSGTVAAALEAAFLGVPAIAISMTLGSGTPRFELGALWARRTLDKIMAAGLPKAHECLSVNIPPTHADGLSMESPMPPVKVCPMNVHGLVDKYERRLSPGGQPYYWASGHGLDFRNTDQGSDVDELQRGCITVTPLSFNMTATTMLEAWRVGLAR